MAEPIAIIGMATIFPGAPDLRTFHENLRNGVDAIGDPPAGRWDDLFHAPGSTRPDRLYCRRGGFIGDTFTFDPAPWGIMPLTAQGIEPDQLVSLELAAQALRDAGIEAAELAGRNTGVVLGRGGYMTPGLVRLEQFVRTTGQLELMLKRLLPELEEAQWEKIRERFQQSTGYRPDTAIGLVPNLAASRIANRLDLNGPAYTVDAACASSLLAVEQACNELHSGRCDTMLAGGVHLCNDALFWSVFTQLGALSRSQQIRPFDRRADGLLIGEGGGMVVLRQLADAERDGNRIYALLRGVGVASDGRASSVMSPRSEGQLLAVRRAWQAAGVEPDTAGYVEAHGTATPAGDEVELETLARAFGTTSGSTRSPLGSVKSMIGHTMPAAGIAGLIKAALSVAHGEIYPSLHCEEPSPLLKRTRFRVPETLEPWAAGAALRRAAVSAFGFGGINAHAVLEQHRAASPHISAPAATVPKPFLAAGSDPAQVLDRLARNRPGGSGACRVAVFDPTPERLSRAARIVERGNRWAGRNGIFYSPQSLAGAGGRIVFLFPGIEAQFHPRVDHLARSLHMAPPPAAAVGDLRLQGLGLVMTGRILDQAVRRLGITPDAVAGHSVGEWTAMLAAGMVPASEIDGFIESMLDLKMEFPDVVFAALGCSAEMARERIDGIPQLFVTHDNCPHQSIVCGPQAQIHRLVESLRADGILCQELPFRSGFHAPFLEPQIIEHRQIIEHLPLQSAGLPIWSATTASPYPSSPEDVRKLAVEHLTQPVRFRELVEALHQDGFRVFVQLGSGSLTSFIEDTLQGRDHLAISACSPKRDAKDQVQRVGAALWVEGFPVWEGQRGAESTVTLRLGAKLVDPQDLPVLSIPGAPPAVPEFADDDSDPVLTELAATMDLLTDAQRELRAQWLRLRDGAIRSRPRERTRTLRIGLTEYPELLDHSFYRQPAGRERIAERFPVIPMTMHLELMMEAARSMVPGRRAIAVEKVQALRWLPAFPTVDVMETSHFDGDCRVTVRVGDYAVGTVVLANEFATPPSAGGAEDPGMTLPAVEAGELYTGRWMFHGPSYRAVRAMLGMSPRGIHGRLSALPAAGALLDGAGQLMGYWIMAHTDRDRLAFPVRIERIEFFSELPGSGETVDCQVRIRDFKDVFVTADMELAVAGRVVAAIRGWTDRRFETDDPLFELLRFPERALLAEAHSPGFHVAREHWTSVASRELVARRYLSASEFAEYQQREPRSQRSWLLGRIAVKDAVRARAWRDAPAPLYPVDVAVWNLPGGQPVAEITGGSVWHVSLSHKPSIAVAVASPDGAVGIDVESVEPRGEGFESVAFSAAERDLLPGVSRAEWITRAWTAKEAYAKSVGTGLQGDPKRIAVEAVEGNRMLVRGPAPHVPRWIETVRLDDHVVAVTLPLNAIKAKTGS